MLKASLSSIPILGPSVQMPEPGGHFALKLPYWELDTFCIHLSMIAVFPVKLNCSFCLLYLFFHFLLTLNVSNDKSAVNLIGIQL